MSYLALLAYVSSRVFETKHCEETGKDIDPPGSISSIELYIELKEISYLLK